MMKHDEAVARLHDKGVKPTTNRILILKELYSCQHPVSLSMLEMRMPDIDKSSIFRVLTLFLEHDIIHAFEDGRGILNYELCESKGECHHNDNHVHFYCESCKKSFCMRGIPIPHFVLPEGFSAHSTSFVIKGECPECRKKGPHV